MNLLIVDDSRTVRRFHRSVLEPLGHDIDEAENGLAAMERCLTQSFDLMLVDVNMPRLDGCTFVRDVRSHSELCHIPVIMISTESQPVDYELAYSAGATFYLVKPVDPEQLRAVAAALLPRES